MTHQTGGSEEDGKLEEKSVRKKHVKPLIERMLECEHCMEVLLYALDHASRNTELGIHFSKEHNGEYHVHHGGNC